MENLPAKVSRQLYDSDMALKYLRLSHALPEVVHHVMHHHCRGKSYCLHTMTRAHTKVWQISSPSPAQLDSRNNGNYDPVPYQYFGYPKVARNMLEMDQPTGNGINQANPIAERVLRPRYLCFLREEGEPAMIMNVDEW